MAIPKTLIKNLIKITVYGRENVFYSILNSITFYLQDIQCTNFPRVKGLVHINNKGLIQLGKNVWIDSGAIHNPIGGDKCYFSVKPNAQITIGDNTRLSNVIIYASKSIEIGKNVFLGGGCKIYDSDFHSLMLEERLEAVDLNIKSKPVKINDGAFIGTQSILLKGVTVGENSVVGAGSIVTKDIPPNEIWAGNPARFIRKLC